MPEYKIEISNKQENKLPQLLADLRACGQPFVCKATLDGWEIFLS